MPLTITVTPGALPQDGDVITNATLRAIANPTVDLEGSIGSSSIADGSVTTAKLADTALSANTTGRAKMEDGFVTAAKIEASAVTTVAILDAAVTPAKLTEATWTGTGQYAADTTNTNSYAITLSPAPTAYAAGMVVRFKVTNGNTSAVTLNVNALGAKSVKTRDGKDLLSGQIAAGALVTATYDGTNFQTDITSRYTGTAAATLAAGVQTFAHGLGVTPSRVRVVLLCTTNQSPWTANDELDIAGVFDSGGSAPQIAVYANSTNVKVTLYSTGLRATSATSTYVTLTAGSWKVKVYAEP